MAQFDPSKQDQKYLLHQGKYLDLFLPGFEPGRIADGNTAGLGCLQFSLRQLLPILMSVGFELVPVAMGMHFHFSVTLLIPFEACGAYKGAVTPAVITAITVISGLE